jgi:hypothetical protein
MPTLRLFPPRREAPLPPLAGQLRNAARATARLARAIATGARVFVSPETAAARLAACQTCPHYRLSDARCALCGCCLGRPLLDKLRLATETCPANPPRWA